MATNLPSCFSIEFLEQLLKFRVNFTLLKYVKSQRSYGFLITKELIFGFQILDLKDHFSASLNLTSTCIAFQHLITQSLQLWKKLSLALCTRETYASLFQQKVASENSEKVLRDKISAFKNNLDNCTTSLKSKEEELNDILEPPDGRVTPSGEKVFTTLLNKSKLFQKMGTFMVIIVMGNQLG